MTIKLQSTIIIIYKNNYSYSLRIIVVYNFIMRGGNEMEDKVIFYCQDCGAKVLVDAENAGYSGEYTTECCPTCGGSLLRSKPIKFKPSSYWG